MIDLHVHLLPEVDDGPDSLELSLAMCRMAAADGVTAAIATPHQRHPFWANSDRRHLELRFAELRLAAAGTPTLYLGAEIHLDSTLLNDTDALPGGALLPLAGSCYLLLECGPSPAPGLLREAVHELTITGWRPVLAHPERIPWLIDQPQLIADLVALGARTQLTASSLFGASGRLAQQCCEWLLEEDLAHFVASDGHHPELRPPLLSQAHQAITDSWGRDTADQLMIHNPQRVIDNQPIP